MTLWQEGAEMIKYEIRSEEVECDNVAQGRWEEAKRKIREGRKPTHPPQYVKRVKAA